MHTKKILLAALLASAYCSAQAGETPAAGPQATTEKQVFVIEDGDQVKTGDGDRVRVVAGGENGRERVRTIVTRGDGALQLAALDEPRELRAVDALPANGALQNMQVHLHGKPVKNAPYTAEVVSEQVQTLADGNQIVHKSVSYNYRDAAGDTRQESRDEKGELQLITINNAAEGVTYLLNPRSKTATKVGLSREAVREIAREAAEKGRAAGEKARVRIEELRKDGKLPAVISEHEEDGHEVIVKRVERGDGDVHANVNIDTQIRENVQVRINQMKDGKNMNMDIQSAVSSALGNAFGDSKWSGKAVSKELGTREFEGVKAEGKLRSYEIPAGEIGNKNAITVSNETWYAPDLQITVYSKHSDPRSGERIFRLASLKREEPAAALFAVPSDYALKNPMAKIKMQLDKKPAEKSADKK